MAEELKAAFGAVLNDILGLILPEMPEKFTKQSIFNWLNNLPVFSAFLWKQPYRFISIVN
jgi:hypothetical protein